MRTRRQVWCAAMLAVGAAVCVAASARAQDDWQVVERHSDSAPRPKAAPAASAGSGGVFIACGEKARAATEPYKSIVANLESMYGVNYPVYQSVAAVSPHATTGGCIFYNPAFLSSLLGNWMDMQKGQDRSPMLYAIFAHELGHQIHGDVDGENPGLSTKQRELAADQFAGYTLERMGFRRLFPEEITKYYQLTGDDFIGPGSGGDHGTGEERTTAFLDGWNRAELGVPEEGAAPAGGLGER
jgi:hypothetical protein